jgi:hypothetical protein
MEEVRGSNPLISTQETEQESKCLSSPQFHVDGAHLTLEI